ncbi:hypothetical protein Tco_0810349 [Tanacetum coccineum]
MLSHTHGARFLGQCEMLVRDNPNDGVGEGGGGWGGELGYECLGGWDQSRYSVGHVVGLSWGFCSDGWMGNWVWRTVPEFPWLKWLRLLADVFLDVYPRNFADRTAYVLDKSLAPMLVESQNFAASDFSGTTIAPQSDPSWGSSQKGRCEKNSTLVLLWREQKQVCLLCEGGLKQIPAFDFFCASLESISAIEDTWERVEVWDDIQVVQDQQLNRRIRSTFGFQNVAAPFGGVTAGYDKSKVECFNCHKMRPFSKECRVPRNKEGQFKYQDNTRKQGNNEDTSLKAMLAIDGVGFDWSDMAEEQVQTNMALMAFSDSE